MAPRYRPFTGPLASNKPPEMRSPPVGEAPLEETGVEREMTAYQGPRANKDRGYGDQPPGNDQYEPRPTEPGPDTAGPGDDDGEEDDGGGTDDEFVEDCKQRGIAAYRTAIDWFNTNYRKNLEDSLRAFNNQHPSDSKYNSETFKKRSNLFRPKTRTIMRKNEAALCAALFSNLDLIEVTAANPSEQEEIVSAEVMQQLLQERLTITMPWFQFAMGGIQDAQNQGVAICHSYWRYTAVKGRNGTYYVREDRPVQELIAAENFLFDSCAKWYDPVNTSPYIIEKIPMYVADVKERMEKADPKGRKWTKYDDQVIASWIENEDESTRNARSGGTQDPTQQPRNVTDYDIVWVHRHIHRYEGEDIEWYMGASRHMLTDPEPLIDNVWFGERPYVIGTTMIETHKAMPQSPASVWKPLQDEANDIDNQLSDNMKFILNKAWFVKRSANIDVSSLVRNTPGRVTQVNDPEKDVKEVNWPDLPQSAFEQKSRNDADFDALAGNFNPMAMQQQRTPRESYRTVNAVQSPAMMITEYTLMTFVQTFLLPCLRHLVLLEQYYETDQVLLAIAGQKAKVLQRFGVSEITDAILEKRMSVNVNLGMGATDPTTKQQRFSGALNVYAALTHKPVPGLDIKEVGKELFALAGYRDAMRFFGDVNPEVAKLQQTIQALMKKLAALEIQKHDRHEANVVKLVTSREKNMVELLKAGKEDDHESRHLLVGHLLEMEKIDKAAEHARTAQAEGAMQSQAGQAQNNAQQTAGKVALAKAQPGKAA